MNDVPKKSSAESVKIRNEGNKLFNTCKHNKKIHLDILSLYNQSAAEAEIDSEEFALAVSNRSVLLMHLNMHKEALIDIEKSYGITKSDELKTKLLTRKMKCLSLMNYSGKEKQVNDTQKYKVPIINKVSRTIPCAADCITIAYDKYYGRCIFATEDIEAGTLIVKEKGVVLLPKPYRTYSNCSHCLMLAPNGIPCNSCSAIIYCSEQCRDEAWLQYHDVECLILPYIEKSYENLIFTFRLLIIFIKKEGLKNIKQEIKKIKLSKAKDGFIEGFFENGLFQSDKFQSIYNLPFSDKNRILEDFIFSPIIKRIIQFLMTKTEILKGNNKASASFLEEVVYKIKWIIDKNAYSFQDRWASEQSEEYIGSLIATFSSLFNHSCNDYTSRGFTDKHEMFIYTTRFIKKGEQIFTNYSAPLEMDKNSRQEKLKSKHNFICQCKPCIENWPKLKSIEHFDEFNIESNHEFLTFQFIINNIQLSAIDIFFGGPIPADSLNETNLKDIKKMFKIVQRNFTGFQAELYLKNIHAFLDSYFNNFSVKILSIPNTC